MRKKQFLSLFFSGLITATVGNGLLPLLPVFATNLGANPEIVGYYLSLVYSAIFTGTVVAGWISDRFQKRKGLLIAVGIVGIPVIWLIGQATNIWQLTVLTAILWFLGGMGITLTMILIGLFTDKTNRGKYFGLLSMYGPLSLIVGGLTSGPIADRWGYPFMFVVLSLLWSTLPFIVFFLEDKVVVKAQPDKISDIKKERGLGVMFFISFLASILALICYFIGRLGVSLTMNNMNFAATAISNTGTIAGVVALPIPPLIGWLSDRIGRKRLLAVFYLTASIGMLILTVSASLWQFYVAFSLISVLPGVNKAVGTALVTDLVQQDSVGRGISLFSGSQWISGIIGFAFTGYAIQYLGIKTTLTMGVLLPMTAVILLTSIRLPAKVEEAAIP